MRKIKAYGMVFHLFGRSAWLESRMRAMMIALALIVLALNVMPDSACLLASICKGISLLCGALALALWWDAHIRYESYVRRGIIKC